MKKYRILFVLIAMSLASGSMAQDKKLNEDGTKAQKALIEHLRSVGLAPSIDTRDQSVCFKYNDVFFWVTFDEESPVLYTLHRRGLKFDDDPSYKLSCARVACNEVNRKHNIKSFSHDKRIDFVIQTYAKNPSDFHGGLKKMLDAFKDVVLTFKNSYDKAYDKWKKDSIANNSPIVPKAPVGKSPLKIESIAFGNFDVQGNVINDYNQPLRRSAMKFIKASVEVSSSEKGIFKLGMKIFNPDGKAMVATKGVEYSSTSNVEIKKSDKPQLFEIDAFGSNEADFWKAGEYKVEIYDFEKGALLHKDTFNLL